MFLRDRKQFQKFEIEYIYLDVLLLVLIALLRLRLQIFMRVRINSRDQAFTPLANSPSPNFAAPLRN